jgi:hypothetical protein
MSHVQRQCPTRSQQRQSPHGPRVSTLRLAKSEAASAHGATSCTGGDSLGTGLGDRFEVSQGCSGLFEGGVRQPEKRRGRRENAVAGDDKECHEEGSPAE